MDLIVASLILLLIVPVTYGISWLGATAYFNAKLTYQRQLFRHLHKPEEKRVK